MWVRPPPSAQKNFRGFIIMATITRENIALLTDKVVVKLNKEDYLPAFEQSIKKYAKTANLPGFRKGMVPASLVKKMYGQSVFTDEVLRTVEKELNNYMVNEQLDIFAQPLPLESDSRAFDLNNPNDYSFAFQIGLKPSFELDTKELHLIRYNVQVTDEMVSDEVNRLQTRHGKMTEPETVSNDENVLNLEFITTEEEFRNGVKVEIENYYRNESTNQLHDQMYHQLIDHTQMEFPEDFLKKWLQDGAEKTKSPEEAEKEYPTFVNQLKWTLISS